MLLRQLFLLICPLLISYTLTSQQSSDLIFLDQGVLTYTPFAMEGQSNAINVIPDFSHAGYRGGGVPIPDNIIVQVTVFPEQGDDTQRIQAAIDLVEALEPDQDGFRGVVLLKAGHYSLSNLLLIRESGVVLRGEGQGLDGTVLHSNIRADHSVVSILGPGSYIKEVESTQTIVDDYVPVGTYTLSVVDGSLFEVGDNVVITRTPNQVWIDTLGMDQETLCEDKSDCSGWTPSSYTIDHERVVTEISGNLVTLNIPIVDVIEESFGGGLITKILSNRRISNCGVENMRIQSFYTSNTDEDHAWTAVRIKDAENCWVKKVTGQYLAYSTVNIESANFTTVEDCAYIEPKSKVTGGRRYSFAIQDGLGNLFQRCFADDGRHDFVTGSRVTGPNVFLDGLATNSNSDIGPHHRWATGTLFDNIRGGSTRVWNRGNSGTGHGWSGAQTLFWNIDSYGGEFRVDSPLGSRNWGIGCIGTTQTGEGYWESWGANVLPRSLYIQQLLDRLGQNAIDNTLIPQQLSGDIYGVLSDWRGEGDILDGGFTGEMPSVNFADPMSTLDVTEWEGGDIQVEANDSDGTIVSVRLLLNGEPMSEDDEKPYHFANLKEVIQKLSHEVHYLQAIATDNDGNTNIARLQILGGDPPITTEEEDEQRLEIRVYPVPASDSVITLEMIEDREYTTSIYDNSGRLVDQFQFEGIDYLLNTETLELGVYFIEIRDERAVVFRSKILII